MKILLIHQNIPGQFRHLISYCAQDPRYELVAVGEKKRLLENVRRSIPGVKFVGYEYLETPREKQRRDLWSTDNALSRGRVVGHCLKAIRAQGFSPDIVYGHPGWGEMLYVRDVFPCAKIVNYCEFYFNREGQDYGFDPEFPEADPDGFQVRTENMTHLLSLTDADVGVSPTHWQRSRYPKMFQQKISVIHDGIDVDLVKPDPTVRMHLPQRSLTLTKQDEVITYVSRNLEPYRGFHSFMRALPSIQQLRPKAHILIVGGEEVSYGRPSVGGTYKEKLLQEVGTRLDFSRIHFLGRLSYRDYLRVLQVSSVHLYLTYPFVLSWSALEAMACGTCVIGSKTKPVEEIIEDGKNGFLVDFFSKDAIAETVAGAIGNNAMRRDISDKAIRSVQESFDLRKICLPTLLQKFEELAY